MESKNNYALIIKIKKITMFIIIDILIISIWCLFANSDYSSEEASKLSYLILFTLLIIPAWKLKLWTVFTEKEREGKITDIKMKYVLKAKNQGMIDIGRRPNGTDSMGNRYYCYEYFLSFEDKKKLMIS